MATDNGAVRQPDPQLAGAATSSERMGPWAALLYAAVWLIFLVSPLSEVLQHGQGAWRAVGAVALVAFAVLYLWAFGDARSRRRAGRPLGVPRSVGILVVLAGLGALSVPAAGQQSLAVLVYLTVGAMVMLPTRAAWVVAGVLAAAGALLPSVVPGWDGDHGIAISVLLAAFVLSGIVGIVERNAALTALNQAREELARLALEEERARFARDLHDILGHSLTVIAVKSELAGRLMEGGRVDGAQEQLHQVQALARSALADIRATVSGVRQLSLAGELATARSALTDAGIAAELPTAVDDVPEAKRELFAWALREGVTNVIRHSRARRCTVTLSDTFLEVSDDGDGVDQAGRSAESGHGLTGLRERARRHGGEVTTSCPPAGGYRLRVTA